MFNRSKSEDEDSFMPHGRYLVAPDSTPPVATTLFMNLTPEGVEQSVQALQKRAEMLDMQPIEAFFYFSPEDKAKLGLGSAALLGKFDDILSQRGFQPPELGG